MEGSIKLFQLVQKIHQIIGLGPRQLYGNRRSITVRRTIILFGNAVYILPTIAYLLFEAELMFDYGMASFVCASGSNSTVVYLLFIWRFELFSKFIESCEKFISTSKH